MEIITKEVSKLELVEKLSKGVPVLDENEMPVMEEKEVVEQKEFVREYIDIAKEEKILQLQTRKNDNDAEIARRTADNVEVEAKLLELTK
jgi:hypothetical protein